MRIFLAGANGAIGRPLTAMLVAAGHEVTGTTRSAGSVATIEAAGARAAVVDVFDRAALIAAVAECRPDTVIHQVTSLATRPGEALTDEQLAANAHVRVVGTRNLIDAACQAGVHRLVAQSIAWLYLPGPEPHSEDESIVPSEPDAITATRRGAIELERMVTTDRRFDGIVLRYGRLYGPGTWSAGADRPPTVHVNDAARAALLAVDHGEPGIYHIVNDGGPVSNAKARDLLGWVAEPV